MIIAISILEYLKTTKDEFWIAFITKWTLIFIAITSIMSIYASYIDPTYARMMIGGRLDEVEFERFSRLGAGAFGFAGMLPFLFPMMFYFYRNSHKSIFSKKQIILFGIITFFALIRIQIFANILLSVILIFISFLGSKNVKLSISLTLVILIIFFFIPNSYYASLLIKISSYFSTDSNLYFKLNDLASALIGQVQDNVGIGGRLERYPLLYAAFINSPILGHAFSNSSTDIDAGGHLYWMNKLAVFGVFGFLLFIKIHINHIKEIIVQYDEEFLFYFSVSVIGGLGLGLMKNLAEREYWFTYFILLHGIYYLPIIMKTKPINDHQ